MAKFCVHEQHAGICEKTGSYCNEGACPYAMRLVTNGFAKSKGTRMTCNTEEAIARLLS